MQARTPLRRTRRDLIRAAAATAAATALGMNQPRASAQPTQPATAPSTAPLDAITTADVAAADKLAGRDHVNDDDRKLMLDSLETYRKRLRKLRATPVDASVDPAVRFDPRLPGFVPPAGASKCIPSAGPEAEFDGNVEALAFASVRELAPLLKAGRVTSVQLTRMCLDRLRRFGPRLLCVVNLTEDRAMAAARKADAEIAAGAYRGPLHGIPYGAKDLLFARGAPTTYGVSVFKDQVPDFDATVIRRLESAGAVLLAKLSLGELAMGDVWYGGKTRTPWDARDGSSGSSAGSCAAVAAGLLPFAIGSETLGSIISPCVVNGTTGLRPTWGRISRAGALPLTWTMDKLGPIARDAEDCALVLSAIAGADELDPTAADVPFAWDPRNTPISSLRIGFDPAAFDWQSDRWKDESLRKIYQEAFDQVRGIAGEMKPVTLPPAERYNGLAGTIIAVESSSAFGDLLTSGRIRELVQQGEGSWPNTFRVGATVPAADYLRALRLRTMLMREMRDAMKDVDVMVTVPYAGPTLAFTNLTGHPSLITRCGMHNGRPRMIELVGNLYREDAICRVAMEYQRATDWRKHRPDVDALPESPP